MKLYCVVIQSISFLDVCLIDICVHPESCQITLKMLVSAIMCTVSSEQYGRNAEALVSHNTKLNSSRRTFFSPLLFAFSVIMILVTFFSFCIDLGERWQN